MCFSLPSTLKFMPVLANGHIGLTVFSDSIYMNGLYNGRKGLSHRARIPNYSNIQIKNCASHFDDHLQNNNHHQDQNHHQENNNNPNHNNCRYSLNTKYGYFKIQYKKLSKITTNTSPSSSTKSDHITNNDDSNNTVNSYTNTQNLYSSRNGNGTDIYNNAEDNNLSYRIEQYIYTHRYYSRAIVNLVIIKRDNYRGN